MRRLLVFAVLLIPLVCAETLEVTEEHPFLLNGEWVEAKDLSPGDLLQTVDGKQVRITEIARVEVSEPFPVYNIEAGKPHDFVVGLMGLIVHNKAMGTKDLEDVSTTADEVLDDATENLDDLRKARSLLNPKIQRLLGEVDDLEILAQFEMPLRGNEGGFVYRETSMSVLKDIEKNFVIKPIEDTFRKDHADLFNSVLQKVRPDLSKKGFSRTAVYAHVDEELRAAAASPGEVVLKIRTTDQSVKPIVVRQEYWNEGVTRYDDYIKSGDSGMREMAEGWAEAYWESAIPLSEFKRYYYWSESAQAYIHRQTGQTMLNPEVLMLYVRDRGFSDALPNIQIVKYPNHIEQLFSETGVSSANEALDILEDAGLWQ